MHAFKFVALSSFPPESGISEGLTPYGLLYLLSSPQFVQDVAPGPEYLPAGHGVLTECPPQVYPAGHFEHVVRVWEVPPDV